MTRVLVTGANGQLARCIQDLAIGYPQTELVFKSKSELDITNLEDLENLLNTSNFDYCVNCAAYTAVDMAEEQISYANSVNVLGVEQLAKTCKTSDTVLVHISTDFVFDGKSNKPYLESDLTNPLNIYGESKLKGEEIIRALMTNYFIIRTSWLYSEYGSNFVKTMIRLGREKEELNIVDDQIGSPTYARDLAHVVLKMITTKNQDYGLYHYSNGGTVSWFEFASYIFQLTKQKIKANPISSSQYPTAAKRPQYSALDTSKIKNTLNTPIRNWKNSLGESIFRMQIPKDLTTAIEASIQAGDAIMKIYDSVIDVEYKDDKSPLTQADKDANTIINSFLVPTGIPIISEENKQIDYNTRQNWSMCWIVDPVDGTKEFIKRNGEFTVNIALVKDGTPVFGVIYAPALKTLYIGDVLNKKAMKANLKEHKFEPEELLASLKVIPGNSIKPNQVRVVGSRSHMNEETLNYVETIKREGKEVDIVSKGSSLKFCLVAENLADVYPRFAPTMEWDTAAGQAICEAAGLSVISNQTNEPLQYNKENLLNPWFLVSKT